MFLPSIFCMPGVRNLATGWGWLMLKGKKIAGFLLGFVYFFGGGRWVGYWLFYIRLCSRIMHDCLMIRPCWATPAAFSQVLACALLVFYRREKVGSVTTLGHGLPPTKNVGWFKKVLPLQKCSWHEITWDYWKCCWHVYIIIIYTYKICTCRSVSWNLAPWSSPSG